jgi:hypothetical protein
MSRKRQFFRNFFRRKYLKNHNIGPRWAWFRGIPPGGKVICRTFISKNIICPVNMSEINARKIFLNKCYRFVKSGFFFFLAPGKLEFKSGASRHLYMYLCSQQTALHLYLTWIQSNDFGIYNYNASAAIG